MREGFGSEAAAPRHRVTFLAIAIGLSVVFALTYDHANLAVTPLPAFIPAYISAVIVTELITAYLLFVHTPLARRFDILFLAGAYLFSSAMATGQLMVFPGVLAVNGLFGAGQQSAVWIWVLWHGGFPVLVIAAMVMNWRQTHGASPGQPKAAHGIAMAAFVLCLATSFEILVTRYQTSLPQLINGLNYAALAHSPSSQIVLATCRIGVHGLVNRG